MRPVRARYALGGIGLLSLLLATPAAASHDKTDIVKVDDGGVYVGEFKSVLYETLNLKTNSAGLVSIEWRHVTGLTSKFEYRVELSGGVRHFGSLGPAKEPGHLSIVGSSGPIEVDLADVVEIVPIEHGFWKRLDGSVNFGLTYTQANDALQYNLSGDANLPLPQELRDSSPVSRSSAPKKAVIRRASTTFSSSWPRWPRSSGACSSWVKLRPTPTRDTTCAT